MSKPTSEQEIKSLFSDFQSIKKYAQKVHFFDLHFNVVPFDFPEFEVDVHKIFSPAGVEKLAGVLKLEQRKAALLDRIFHFQDDSYTFSIRPSNSNALVLNNYILSKFMNRSSILNTIARQKRFYRRPAKLWEELLTDANEMIIFLRKRIDAEYEGKASLETKLMAVFMKGYADRTNDLPLPRFVRRRKFVELYLYAYGYSYGDFTRSLCEPAGRSFLFSQENTPKN
jgi:hypothetical protein